MAGAAVILLGLVLAAIVLGIGTLWLRRARVSRENSAESAPGNAFFDIRGSATRNTRAGVQEDTEELQWTDSCTSSPSPIPGIEHAGGYSVPTEVTESERTLSVAPV